MGQSEKLIAKLANAVTPNEAATLLESAEAIILSHRFPYGDGTEKLEPRFYDLQVRIAVELYSKQGAEGQLSHSENGIARSYESAGVSPSLIQEITPKAGRIL